MRYIVLGMHKSGTTLMARLLHHAGIPMVEEASSEHYEEDNFYEREATYHINLELIHAAPDELDLHAPPQSLHLHDDLCNRMQTLIQQLDQQYDDWGFKDPRTCLVYDAWRDRIGTHKLIVTFRPVQDLWHRFVYRGFKIWLNLTRCIRLVQRWCEYNHAVLNILNTTTMPALVVSYPHFIQSDDDFKQFEVFVGRAIPDQRIKTERTSHHPGWLFALSIWIVRVWTGLDYHEIYHQLNDYYTSTAHAGDSL